MKLRATIVFVLLLATLSLVAEDSVSNVEIRVLESFDDPAARLWAVRGSRFVTDGYPQMNYVDAWPRTAFGQNWENQDLKCLGIYGKFDRAGYNYIEIFPVTEDATGNLVPDSIMIPPIAKRVDMWVWGSNYNYYLEMHVLDYRGVDHVLPLGSLRFRGWKRLSVTIPSRIPQLDVHLPRYQEIEFTKLVLWTRPQERVDGFYVYFDQMKVLTDTYREDFDGNKLLDEQMVEQIWGSQID